MLPGQKRGILSINKPTSLHQPNTPIIVNVPCLKTLSDDQNVESADILITGSAEDFLAFRALSAGTGCVL